tara:strand:- start:303 stop:686 length:384 start_codon:yes stop_codon:yes gene_type:complete
MKLLIIKENFDLERILFRESKKAIKISYDINYISMIGITIKILYEKIEDRGTYIIIKIHPNDIKLFYDIDNYLNKKLQDYEYFMINGNIKVKKHIEYETPQNKNISITMNSIKKNISGKNKVQIFSI